MSPRITATLEARYDWRKPRPGELLYDAEDFFKKARKSQKGASKGRYARASILLSVAAIEAMSNETLFALYEFLGDAWPSECLGLPPWLYFKRVSYSRVGRLLYRQGSLSKKIRYILAHLNRLSDGWKGQFSDGWKGQFDELEGHLKIAVQSRNRIVHMSYSVKPSRYSVLLNPRQVAPLAQSALDSAKEFICAVSDTFEGVNLPVSISWHSYQPDWWADEDWE
jgi:hypothetical protein